MKNGNKTENRISLLFAGITAGLLAVLFFWHFLDVRDSVTECGDVFLYRGYVILGVYLFGVCFGLYMLGTHSGIRFPVMAAAAVFLTGLAYIFVFRGLSAPDEISHFVSAYRLSNVIMQKEAADENGLVFLRACGRFLEDTGNRTEEVLYSRENGNGDPETDLVIFGQTLDENVYRVYEYPELQTWGDRESVLVSHQWTVNTTPAAYLPQALGITAARLLELDPLGLITAGKLFNLIFFTIAATAALFLMPRGAEPAAGTMLLPMTLHLAGSMSYDVFVMAMSFLFTALILRIRESEGECRREMAAAAVVIALLGPCKMVYSLLILMVLILFPAEKAQRRNYLIFTAAAVLLLALSMYLVNSRTLQDYASADERIITWAEEPEGYTLAYLIHRPVETVRMMYHSFLTMSGNWFSTMFGVYLGNQDPIYNVPYPVIGIFSLGLLVLAAGSSMNFGAFERIVCAGVFFLVLGALMGSMLLAYTPMSSTHIEGVQGRYLLPVLPLLLFCIPGPWITVREGQERGIIWLFAVLNAYVLIRVYATVCLRL